MSFVDRFDDEEKRMEEEKRIENKKLRNMLLAKDRELAKQQRWERNNMCPNCHLVLTKQGYCVNICGYIKPKKKTGRVTITQREVKPEVDYFKLAKEERDREKVQPLDPQDLVKLMNSGMTLGEAVNQILSGGKQNEQTN